MADFFVFEKAFSSRLPGIGYSLLSMASFHVLLVRTVWCAAYNI
jgi:hypothetical protein